MPYDPIAERKLRNKIDLMIVPTVALLYLFCFIDRANIGKMPGIRSFIGKKVNQRAGNARLANLEEDLNMTGYGSFLRSLDNIHSLTC